MADTDTTHRPLPLRETYAASVNDVLAGLRVEAERGLDPVEVDRRRQQFGHNVLPESRPKTTISILYDQVRSLIVLLLAVAAAVSFLFGHWSEGAAIVVVITINTAIRFVTEFRAIRSMEALRRLSIVTARVRRGGRVMEIPSRELVPGDIVVETGNIVGADLRLLTASRLRCDESVLTGASLPVTKGTDAVEQATALPDRINMAYQGAALTTRSAEGIVGDPMEGALLILGEKAGIRRISLLESRPETREDAFDPHLMMMATVHRTESEFQVAVEGVPEAVLDCCVVVLSDGAPTPLAGEERETWLHRAGTLAGEGLRVLGLSMLPLVAGQIAKSVPLGWKNREEKTA